jgi:hypothetical protein
MAHRQAKLNPTQVTALRQAVSPNRFAVFAAAASGDAELACRLYLWDRDLAAAILRDVAIVEVALRNALSAHLVAVNGSRWFADTTLRLDRRLDGALRQATESLTRMGKPHTSDRVTAELSLGFWVNLFDARSSERLWQAGLYRAFPGGRIEANAVGARYQRPWVQGQLRVMRYLRNRCAHHEPLIHGVPLPGQSARVSVPDGIAGYLRLTRMIDRNLANWMVTDTVASTIHTARPQTIASAKPKEQA